MAEYIIGGVVGWIAGSIGTALTLCLFMGSRKNQKLEENS